MADQTTDKNPLPSIITPRQLEIIQKELHSQAAERVETLTTNYGTTLLLQAKTLAHGRNDDIVLKNHVDEALEVMLQERKKKPWKDWSLALGSAMFGVGIQGFITEVSGVKNPIVLSVYFALGLISLIVMFVGLRR